MPSFSHVIECEAYGYCTFLFDSILKVGGSKYHVATITSNGQIYHFSMEAIAQKWKIIAAPTPPAWILALESELSSAILFHLQHSVLPTPRSLILKLK